MWRDGGRDFRLFWLASALSFVGDGFRYAALPLLATRLGAGPGELGVLLAVATLPFLVIGLAGGILVDRLPRRVVLLACDGTRIVAMAAFVAMVVTGTATLPVLFALAFLMGACETVATSATFALLPGLLPDRLLGRANALTSSALITGRQLAGPMLGAVLIGVAPALPFALDGVTFVLSFLLIFAIRVSEQARPVPKGRGRLAGMRDDLAESARWIKSTPHMLYLVLVGATVNFVNMGALAEQPRFVEHELGQPAIGYGILMASAAVGGLLGSPIAGRLTERVTVFQSVGAGLLLVGGGYLLAGTAVLPAQAYLGVGLTGIGFAVWNVAVVTWRQRVTPDELRGRADAVSRFMSWGILPLGSLVGGLLASVFNARAPFLVAGVVPLLLSVPFALRNRRSAVGQPEHAGAGPA